jgi:hypothetical protein
VSRSSAVLSEIRRLHLPFGGEGCLRHEQGGDGGVADAAAEGDVQRLAALVQRADVAHDFVLLADLDQPGDGVQLVGELVGLRAQ